MIPDLKPYPAMKDSGVEWLGEVPENWKLERGKWLFRKMDRPIRDADEVVTCFRDGIVTLRKNRRVRGFTESLKEIGYQGIRRGDLVIHGMDAFAGAIGVADSNGKGTPVYSVCEPGPSANPQYYAYTLREMARSQWIQALTKGIRERSSDFRFEGFGSQPVPVPPLPEQSAIVRFLDHADRRIRRYIRAKQKLVKLLEEQKQVLIHRAVTGRVDVRTGRPYPAYKDSGVEWLGEVPEHWERARLKAFLLRPMRNGLFKKKDAFGSGAPLVNVADIYHDSFQIDPASLDRVQTTPDELRTYQVRTGDLFFVRSSLKLEGTGRSAVAIDCEAGSVFECHLVQGRPDPRRAVARFLAFQLNSFSLRHYMISRANVVTMATVSQGVLASCPVFLPSISEQEGLLKQIDGECARVAATHDRAHREIDLLHEYRTRLIADVVTGKLDVRKAAAGLPDEVEEPDPFDETGALTDGEEEPSDGFDNTPEEAVV